LAFSEIISATQIRISAPVPPPGSKSVRSRSRENNYRAAAYRWKLAVSIATSVLQGRLIVADTAFFNTVKKSASFGRSRSKKEREICLVRIRAL
jgi:hypothetical protein